MQHRLDDDARTVWIDGQRGEGYPTPLLDPSSTLPVLGEDFVLQTPIDMLTRDDTWISISNSRPPQEVPHPVVSRGDEESE